MKNESVRIGYKLARTIMGNNFFDADDWLAMHGSFSEEQLYQVAYFPWSENILNAPCPFVNGKRIRETHFAFIGIPNINGNPLNILRWHKLLHDKHPMVRFTNIAKDEELFVRDTCALRWYLMPAGVIFSSEAKSTHERLSMLPEEYEFSRAILEVTKNILYYMKNNTYPISKGDTVWCCDILNRFMHVYLRIEYGINVYQSWKTPDWACTNSIAASRKPGV